MHAKRYGGWFLPLLSVAAIGAASPDVRLLEAVKKGDKTAVRSLLQKHADVNAPEPDGTTALHWAARRDDLETANLLIRAGAKVKAANRYGVMPLWVACTNGNAAMVETLLKAGADANSVLPEGETALMTAARTGKVDAVKVLLAHGANVSAKEGVRGQTALMWAAAENHAAVIDALVKHGADVHARSNGGFTSLLFAARAGQIEAGRALLAAGANVNDTVQISRPASGSQADQGSGATVRTQGRQDRTVVAGPEGTSALVMAVLNANLEFAGFLLDHGVDPNADEQGWTALHQLAWTRNPPIQHGLPDPLLKDSLDSLDLAKKLLAHGANPNARQKKEPADGARNRLNRIGSTPFLAAAKVADAEYMRLLAAHGADPMLLTDENTTPLMAAAGVGIWHVGENAGTNEEALEAVKVAYEQGNDVNAVNDNGDTALHGAAHRGATEIVQFLIEKGARPDVRNEIGWTPLTVAEGVFYPNMWNRHPEAAAVLHKLGAQDPGARRPIDLPPAEVFKAVPKAVQTPQ